MILKSFLLMNGCRKWKQMLNCLFTTEEKQFRKDLQKFIKEEIEPYVNDIEGDKYPRELLRLLGQKGYLGMTHPKKYGGRERGWVYETLIAEELGAANGALDMARGATAILYGTPVSKFGTDEQRVKYLKPIICGEKLGCIGITEPLVGSDTAGMQTTAVRDEARKCWVINGEKRFITNGSEADYICLFAITNKEVSSHQGMSAFIFPTDTPGFQVEKIYELLGMHGTRTAHLKFNNCRIPLENLLGEENKGFHILMDELDTERTLYAGTLLGIAKAASQVAVKYSTERVQFGRPIARFEGVSFKIADMAIALEAMQALILRAARLCDLRIPASRETAIAKVFTSDYGFDICANAVQVLGGIGYTTEYPVERYLRDIKLGMIGAGSSEILRFLIQREVFKDFMAGRDGNSDQFYSGEENELREKVRAFVTREVVPHLKEIMDGNYHRALLKKLGVNGYLGYTHAKHYGGQDKGWVQEAIITEEIARASGAASMIRGASCLLFGKPVKNYGTEEQREKILSQVIRGEKIACLGITEPTAGSDVSAIKTLAVKKGGSYIINGEKRFITNGGMADYILVFALSDKNMAPRQKMSCYIVPTDTAGFKVEKIYNLHGMQGIAAAHLKFDNCEVPIENRVGAENQGYEIMMDQFDTERLVFASTMLGIMRAAFNIAVKYSMERVQFGKPIATFEGISFKIADMAIKMEAAAALILKASRLIDQGQKIPMLSAITRVFASDYGKEVCDDAMQVLGGIGYTNEYPLGQYLRDIRLGQIGAGTSEILKFLIQREIYKNSKY
ncbi:MAG: acyl-CoA dehydrogenase [Promethearchaeota archaeon]|nr:MAG: acyl-CoA dehydrogenase [Candidatus Lokiarchaeota archaeon]